MKMETLLSRPEAGQTIRVTSLGFSPGEIKRQALPGTINIIMDEKTLPSIK